MPILKYSSALPDDLPPTSPLHAPHVLDLSTTLTIPDMVVTVLHNHDPLTHKTLQAFYDTKKLFSFTRISPGVDGFLCSITRGSDPLRRVKDMTVVDPGPGVVEILHHPNYSPDYETHSYRMGAQLTDPWTPIAFHRPKTNDHRFEEDILSRGSALASFLLTRKVWERGQGVTLKIMHGKASAEDTVKKRNNQAKGELGAEPSPANPRLSKGSVLLDDRSIMSEEDEEEEDPAPPPLQPRSSKRGIRPDFYSYASTIKEEEEDDIDEYYSTVKIKG